MQSAKLEEIFGVPVLKSDKMNREIDLWDSIYEKHPPWVTNNKDIHTLSFAKIICTETATLSLEEADFSFEGNQRAQMIENFIKKDLYPNMRTYLEYACALGTIIAIPNGMGVRFITPDNFFVTEIDTNKTITGGYATISVYRNDKYYVRAMYMRYEDDVFKISNKAFVSSNGMDMINEVMLSTIDEWKNITPEVAISGIERPLFAVMKMPFANAVDKESPYGVSIIFDVIQQLKDLDVAYSKMMREIRLSDKIHGVSDYILNNPGERVSSDARDYKENPLPENFLLFPGAEHDFVAEFSPEMNTDQRLSGIKQIIALIGYGCGYSQGHFSFDDKRGLLTATQVEAEDKRTIQLISDIRSNCIAPFIEHIAYIYDTLLSLYTDLPMEDYNFRPYFKDITISFNEDRERVLNLVRAGLYPLKEYLIKYENCDESEADRLIAMNREEKLQAAKDDAKIAEMTMATGMLGDGGGGND